MLCVPRTSLVPIVNSAKFVFGALPGQLARAAAFLSQQAAGPPSCGQNFSLSLRSVSWLHQYFFST